MQTSTYLNNEGDCGCDYMKVAYMQLMNHDALEFVPYRRFFDNWNSEIYDVDDMSIPSSKDEVSYCLTSLKTFNVPKPSRVDFSYSCGDKPRNVDYNTISCTNIKYRGWISAINIQNPVALCNPMSAGHFVDRDAIRRAVSKNFLEDMKSEFIKGAFSPVNVNCKDKTIDNYASMVIDATTTGLTYDVMQQVVTNYSVRFGQTTSHLTAFISTTAFKQLLNDYKTNHPECCHLMDISKLGLTGTMIDPLTGIEYVVLPDELINSASGKTQWMIILNDKFVKFVYGSSYLNASMFIRNNISRNIYTDIKGYYNLFNLVERYDIDPIGKMPSDFYSYWALSSFAIIDPLGAIIIKGKA